ncbi:hypothetical protein KZX66_11140 [Pseudomonas sp. EYE_354]|nr:hypothetical protein [Pseudomonas sp. EYE_354]
MAELSYVEVLDLKDPLYRKGRIAVHLADRLRVSTKFGVLAIIVFIPLVLLGTRVIHQINESLAVIRSEQLGQRYLLHVTPVLRLSMLHRALTNRFLSGDRTARADLSANQTKLEDAFSKLAATDSQFTTQLETGDRVQRLHTGVQRLIEQAAKADANKNEMFDNWSDQLTETLNFVYYVSATSGMVLDEGQAQVAREVDRSLASIRDLSNQAAEGSSQTAIVTS